MSEIESGQTWRRKADGTLVVVESYIKHGQFGVPWVVFKGKRTTHAEAKNFLRKYEQVRRD